MNEKLAEFYGALLGDGCLSQYFTKCDQRTRYCVQLTGHVHDLEYYETVLQPTIRNTFGISGTIRSRRGTQAIIFNILNKSAFAFFHDLGMPIGKKHELAIPAAILQNPQFTAACVRGIFNTDGSVYRRYSKQYAGHTKVYAYQVIQFKMNTRVLLQQLSDYLQSNGIRVNRIIRDRASSVLRVTHQPSMHAFMTLIQTPHRYHRERYLKNYNGTCTASGSLAQPGRAFGSYS